MNTKLSLITGSLLFISVSIFAQDKKAQPEAGQPTEQEQKAWQEYMTPGPMHKMLAAANGGWHEEMTFWMAPGTPGTKAEADCVNSMIMGDRYQESVHKGQMMGMPFEGRSLVGYDNARKVFQSTWIDNMSSGIMYTEGKYDEATKTIVLKGKEVDPMTGKQQDVREVFKFVDEKTQMMEMYLTKDGKEFKNMEIKYTKR